MDFVDLEGASGRAYRFRRWPDGGHHPPIAGNYAVLSRKDRLIVELGCSDNLAEARAELSRLPAGLEAFTRLNISRTQREAEHADLAAAHPRSGSAAT
jgi:hypothetical protein